MRVVAVDQGTTSTRSIVFEAGEAPRIALALRHATRHPHPGWVEHDPLELLANVEACLRAAGEADVVALANQGESCLAWDRVSGEPLSPVIVWQDGRTEADTAVLKRQGLERLTLTRAGVPLDPYFSASKLAWLLKHSEGARAALTAGRLRLGTTDSFLLRRLTGIDATDATTASRTSLMDLRTLAWDGELCDAFGVPMDALAPIRPTCSDFGDWRGRRVAVSVVDQQAALFGHGCRRSGEAKLTFGTGAFALALVDAPPERVPRGGLSTTVAWSTAEETRYALEAGVYDAGAAVEWAGRIGIVPELARLGALSGRNAIAQGLVFVPALSGLACPQWDRSAAGLWRGMTTATDRDAMQKSLLEGIALQTREVLEALEREVAHGATLSVDGGVAGSPYFLQFLADVTGREVVASAFKELTAAGCAGLAGLDTGAWTHPRTTYAPSRESATTRDGYIAAYREAVRAARPEPPTVRA